MRTIRKKGHEKLDDANLQRVLDHLNADQPITKKEAWMMRGTIFIRKCFELLKIKNQNTLLQKM